MATSSQNDSDQTDVYQDLSSHLYRVLDVIGVSEEVRDGFREDATLRELQLTAEMKVALDSFRTAIDKVTDDGVLSSYIFGSQYEGTTTTGLQSDTDVLLCDERLQVVENIDDAPVDGPSLLMLSDDTKPGYVKLQSVFNRTKQTINEREVTDREDTDHQGRILIKHVYSTAQNTERHGPADKHPAGEDRVEGDLVYAYRCGTIPSFADEWLHRHRLYQWPSQEQLQRMGSYECFFVGVSHPNSENRKSEWRISFSLQERDLMSSLNPTQHKCYVLLKMIKKDIIEPIVGKSFSSYHCKTCIFHLAESHSVEQWTQNNVVSCILECIRLLLEWVRQENCPNYFIKDENMFDKLDRSTLTRLSLILQELLSSVVQFLYDIKCDDLGMFLTLSKSDRRLEEKKLEVKQVRRYNLNMRIKRDLLLLKRNVYAFIDKASTPLECVSRANHILQYLEHTTAITEHKPRDVRMALNRPIPYVRNAIVQIKCSNRLDKIKREKNNQAVRSLSLDIRLCKALDLISSILIIASLYLHCDKLDSCQEVLQDCDSRLTSYVTSVCGCHRHQTYMNDQLSEKIVAESLSFDEFRREYIAACMIFLPPEANLVPAALRYEMYRSVYTPTGCRDEVTEYWFDWIVVDSKVYLFFLQYILYTRTNKPAYKHAAKHKLLKLIITDPNLGHRETALNLLGWIYMQENRAQDAFVCFRRSLAKRPLHNAAKWHLAILLHSLINTQNSS